MGDFGNTNCIVLFGHNPKSILGRLFITRWRPPAPRSESDCPRPRVSEQQQWLICTAASSGHRCRNVSLRLKVIFDEELYDKDFVRDWCIGFDELKAGSMNTHLSAWKRSQESIVN